MMKALKENPLYKFLFRISIILLLSAIFWIVAIFYYYESQITHKVHEDIMQAKQEKINLLKRINFQKQNIAYYEFVSILKQETKKSEVIFVEIYDRNKKPILKEHFDSYPKSMEHELNEYGTFSEYLRSDFIIHEKEGNYFYYQNKITIDNEKYYINLLKSIDATYVENIKEETYLTIFIIVLTILILAISIYPIVYAQYKSLIKNKNDLILSNLNALTSLGNAVAKRDSDTNEHNYRVTYYSLLIAKKMNLDNQTIEALIKGAFLHDIGKIAISDNVLLKPGKLTNEEFETMKTHVLHGVDIVKNITWFSDATKVILNHHEKVDGTGYPNGIKGDNIPLEARIFAVADVFDALSSKRPYKKALDIHTSFKILQKDAGSHFDKSIVNIFETIFEEAYNEVTHKDAKELKELFEQLLKPYFIDAY